MKPTTNYEARALKFARYLVNLFAGCVTVNDFEEAMAYYASTHSRPVSWAHGVSRFVIMRADYVIKFDMKPTGVWSDGHAGNNESELEVYEAAVEDGFEYLLAKPTAVEIGDRKLTIMPRINGVDDWTRCWWDYCDPQEERWLNEHIGDLHDGNVGYRKGKVCVIDYAWDVNVW